MTNLHTATAQTGSVEPVRDVQTVTPDGEKVGTGIEGVRIKKLVTHVDDRGTLTELYRPSWGIHPDPLQYVKLITVRPGMVKGWVKHLLQDDRIVVAHGTALYVLFDDREDSPTRGKVQEIYVSSETRSIVIIPAGVYHALKNVGTDGLSLINMPNNTYDHANPDKYRLPLTTDVIPYKWR